MKKPTTPQEWWDRIRSREQVVTLLDGAPTVLNGWEPCLGGERRVNRYTMMLESFIEEYGTTLFRYRGPGGAGIEQTREEAKRMCDEMTLKAHLRTILL